jgi:6-pyruvoyltetrahydropterin/6-carboxytetrahydropterin synthase
MIHLTREFRFSAEPAPAPAGPANPWAGSPAASGLAPYLKLQLTVAGEPDRVTGYLCDIKVLDDLLRARAVPPALEMLAASRGPLAPERYLLALWPRLADARPAGAAVVELRLCTTPYIHYTVRREAPAMVQLTEQFEFSAAHRLHSPGLSDEENRELFGKCNNPRGHGHNYVVEVTFAGEVLSAARAVVAEAVRRNVLERFDHKHLNEDTTEFRDLNPTVENIARVVWGLLVADVSPARLTCVRIYETPKTWADYCG